MRTTKAQIRLGIRAVWSAVCFSLPGQYIISTCYSRNFKTLARLISHQLSRTVWFLTGRKPWKQVFSWRGSNVFNFRTYFSFEATRPLETNTCEAFMGWENKNDYGNMTQMVAMPVHDIKVTGNNETWFEGLVTRGQRFQVVSMMS